MSIFATIGSQILGAFAGRKKGQDQTTGVQTIMNNREPPPPAPASQTAEGGSQFSDLIKDEAMEGLTNGIKSVISGFGDNISNRLFGPSAASLGRDNRAYLDASFPELNPWEKAGASAVQQGIEIGKNKQQDILQRRELRTRQQMQREQIEFGERQLEVQERLGILNAEATTSAAGISAAPQMAQVPSMIQLQKMQTELAKYQKNALEQKNEREWISNFTNLTGLIIKKQREGNHQEAQELYNKIVPAIIRDRTISTGVGVAGNILAEFLGLTTRNESQ